MIFLPIVFAFIYCIVLYSIRTDAANAIDENDRMVSTMSLMVVSAPLIPTIWLTSMTSDMPVMSNAYVFYAVTAFIQFFLLGLVVDIMIQIIAHRANQNEKIEIEYWSAIRSSKGVEGERIEESS